MTSILTTLAALGASQGPRSELDGLKAKLSAREGKPGMSDNCKALRARIAELEAS